MNAIGQSAATFPAPSAPRVGLVRELPHTWEVNEYGGAVANNPHAQLARTQAIRMGSPAVMLGPDFPMLDLSDAESRGAYWTRATS